MTYQRTFQRQEIKYLLCAEQKEHILRAMEPYMRLDEYGRTLICNIYYDTPDFRLARRSLEKPVYKEKLRLRSYGPIAPDGPVFVELKKKYRSTVYKRRLALPEQEAVRCFENGLALPLRSQIGAEIDAFRELYRDLRPAVFLSYEREAYGPLDGGDFRVTFDENILYRREDFSLQSTAYGIPLTGKGQTVMEIKTPGGIPLWLTKALSKEKLYPTPFSKYAMAYRKMKEKQITGGQKYA